MNFRTNIKWFLLLATPAIVIMAPDLAVWLLHALFELFNALFEFVEGTLDEIVEHLFHTDLHTTQIIVFYLIWAAALYPAYRIFGYCKKRINDLMETLPCWCKNTMEQAKTNWQQQTFIKKFKLIFGCFIGALGLSYLVF